MITDLGFRDVGQMLSWAYRIEADPIIKISDTFRHGKSSPNDSTPHERHAQSAIILGMVSELPLPEMLAIRAKYTFSERANKNRRADNYASRRRVELSVRKESDCRQLSVLLRKNIKSERWYTVDVVREWARAGRHHTDVWWAERIGRHRDTLAEWRLRSGGVGLVGLLDGYLEAGCGRLET